MDFKELIKRNMPVVVIGGITVLIFVFIIVSAQRRPPDNTTLIEVDNIDLVAPHTYIKGPLGAPVDVIEFTDFGCPACKQMHPIIKGLSEEYSEYVRWGIRHFPLPQHKNADKAAIAAQAAGEQGLFWEYTDMLFENQGKFSDEDLANYADIIGLDLSKFNDNYKSKAFEKIINDDVTYGRQIGISGTPTFFVNGKQIMIKDENTLENAIKKAIKDSGIDIEAVAQEEAAKVEEDAKMTAEEIYKILDGSFKVLEIGYTDEEGLNPDLAQAKAGQRVKWINNTDHDITFKQLMPKFSELTEPFVIAAGEAFEFRIKLRTSGNWTYKIEGDDRRGMLRIGPIPDNLKEKLPESIR